MDFTIPRNCPQSVEEQLLRLINEFQEGYLTEKGYIKKRHEILENASASPPNSTASAPSTPKLPLTKTSTAASGSTSTSQNNSEPRDLDFSSSNADYQALDNFSESITESNTYKYSEEYYYSMAPPQSNEYSELPKEPQKPLDPRDVHEFSGEDGFENLPKILRQRSHIYTKETAILIVDSKAKESQSISWEKLYLRAEKIAQKIKNKAALYPGDRVCLIYQNIEVIDFIVALYGCFLSGTVAVPMSSSLPVREIVKIMTDTQSHLCLMSDTVFKHFEKQLSQPKASAWPKGMDIWKTTDMGLYQPPSKHSDPPAFKIGDLAYIEYSKSSIGESRGVVFSHRTIMHQMRSLTSVLTSMPGTDAKSFSRSDVKYTRPKNIMLSTLDARESIGLINAALYTVFTGNMLIWMPQRCAEVGGLFAHIISKYRVSLILSDYLSLKQVAFNYQSFPQMTRTFNKKVKVDLSCVKWCLINSMTVDCEFNDMLSDRWFKPLGHTHAKRVIAPILSLNEHGGTIISMRDWIGKEENLGCTFSKPLLNDDLPNDDAYDDNSSNDRLSEILIDKASLTTNSVKVVSDHPPSSSTVFDNGESSKYIRVGAFGYPSPDATLAIVNPETKFLSGVMEVGEIWVDSQCISGGFWGLSEATQTIFQAECSDYEGILNLKFVRTSLLGFTYNGEVYVLGLYEDRINQRVTWYDQHQQIAKKEIPKSLPTNRQEYRYHYSSHLLKTLARNIPEVSDCSFFNIKINKEHVPVAIIESPSAKAPTISSNLTPAQLDSVALDDVATRTFEILEKMHNVRLYCLLITAPNVLPRTPRSGRMQLANMLCKKKFMEGKLSSAYVKFNILNSISYIPHGDDLLGGIWSPYSSRIRSEALSYTELQYSGLDLRELSIDDRTNMKLTDFKSILEILKVRALKQPDETAFAMIEGTSVKESKPLSWKKFENRVFAVCLYILEKKDLKSGDNVILMYSLSEDIIVCLYACWLTGLVVIPLPPIDPNRLDEDCSSLVGIIRDYKVKAIFVNNDVETALKNKPVSPKLKSLATLNKVILPKTRNTIKHTKCVMSAKTMYSKLEAYRKTRKVVSKMDACLIWISWTEDHQYSGAELTHSNILAMCKNLKETCQISSMKPILACVRHCSGLGFLQALILGVYLGSATYIISPVDYAINTSSFYLTLSRYKIENVFVTDKMIEHAIDSFKPPKGCNLSHVKNLMIGWSDRPSIEIVKSFKKQFNVTDLSPLSISNVYQHDYNPMITLRSYLSFEPVELWLDPLALSQGYISLVNPNDSPNAIHLQDSGIVPVNTQLAIVNPETMEICRVGEYGEIWVCSESTVTNFTKRGSKSDIEFDQAMFKSKIENWNKDLTYLRTGDFGFLHNVSKSVDNGNIIDLQLLYVLGSIRETFEVLGLQYFARDIEKCVENLIVAPPSTSKPRILSTCVFKSGSYVVLLVETNSGGGLMNMSPIVPLIVNKVFNQFGLIIDIVSFIDVDKFPLSRLGEGQRNKLMKGWLSGSLKISESYGVNFGEDSSLKVLNLMNQTNNEVTKS
ncbi:hypothetical protein CANARDRAFT_197434 [[Candida] arabinofermentans NRRL YB-2248]|uniref:DMAP1-binding domain-containing protein n=1 Tax=[Candida] arabinofermentans NRRL YB-2248 TaxID=983967 RepID=A0A1E4T2Q6_9ASCO|nr:hypothetical protein CANARDRAFT_197434 [[Candida] arabinofermentans NRRL YB-2248]